MSKTELEAAVLEAAARRQVSKTELAKVLGADAKDVGLAIARLRRAKKLYVSERSRSNYYGPTEAGFRAA